MLIILVLGLEHLVSHYQTDKSDIVCRLEKAVPHQPPPPECRHSGRTNALHLALLAGVEENINRILEHKKCPNINSKDTDGWLLFLT